MYKSIFLFLAALTALNLCGQKIILPTVEGDVEFEVIGVVTLPDTSKCQKQVLFFKSRSWMATIFNDANSVIQLEDKDNGRIIGKYINKIGLIQDGGIVVPVFANYTLKVDLKDCRYRLLIKDIFISAQGQQGSVEKNVSDVYSTYSKGIAPKSRMLFESEKQWFRRYDGYFQSILSNSDMLISSFKNEFLNLDKEKEW